MATLKNRLAKAKDAEAAEKPPAGFFDSFEPSGAPLIDQRQWREDTGSINLHRKRHAVTRRRSR